METFNCYRGLRVMPDRPDRKSRQFFYLSRDITIYRDTTHVLFLGGSNDWESFLMQHGQLIRPASNCQRRWDLLGKENKAKYIYYRNKLLHKRSERYLKWKLRVYIQQLSLLFSGSSAMVVYHVSVLERLLDGLPLLPMYFAVLNSLLFSALKVANIKNKFGQLIKFKFINVAGSFFLADNPKELFRPKEVRRGVMTHRTPEAYREVYASVHDYVTCDVYK